MMFSLQSDSLGWVIGDYGFIWHTTDGGLSWSKVESNTTSHLYRIFFFNDGDIGYILGTDSTLLKYNKIVDIKEEYQLKELSFKLNQNYPNPFNPVTTIPYEITKEFFVKIIVYDIMGKEVEELVNKEKSAGRYEVKFNAGDLSSGIYFYTLNAGDFVEIRKLVLLK